MSSHPQTGQQPIVQHLNFQRNNSTRGSFNLFIEHEFPDSKPYFELDLYDRGVDIDVEQLYGYQIEDQHKLIWNKEDLNAKARVSLTFSAHADHWFKDTDEWTLAKRPLYSIAHRGHNVEEHFDTVGDGVVSDNGGLLYLGPYDEWSITAAGQHIRLVVPEAATLETDPQQVLYTLAFAAQTLTVGCLDETVLAVAAPTDDVNWGKNIGLFSGQSGFWVRDNSSIGELTSAGGCTWVHEYVHTRQGFTRRLTPETSWLTEGIASYYGGLLPYLQGLITSDELYNFLTPYISGTDAMLANPDSFEVSTTAKQYDYLKGRMVIAALDSKIRCETDGMVSFDDVFYRLNEYTDRQITYSWLVSLLEKIPGSSGYQDWFERYVRKDAVPKISGSFEYLS